MISVSGYVYMNGDLGKLPSGAVFTSSSATPDQTVVGVAAIPDCGSASAMVNGEVESGGGCYNSPPPPSLGGGASSPAANVTTAQDSSIPLDQLKQMLSSQLEYYFSRENLANDTYLLSQMDNDQYVPIWTVANFNQVKKLTKDINLITEVLRESPNVQVDEEGVKVRPNHKRCIVILREIPDNTPIEEVKNLFSGENCPRLISCEFALNSSWYVTFETDDDAQRAYRFLREEVREFQGKPITARIKAKPMHRMPLPPVASVKNGYRNTAPVAATYDPATVTYPTAQQRFVYTNGAPPQGGYGSQMHVYQYYAPNMLQAWPAAPAAPYYDIGSVFAVNGLSPQSSFKQVAGPRYQPRPRNKRNSVPLQGETRQHLQPPPPGSPQTRPPVKGTMCVNTGQTQAASQENSDVVNAAVTNQNQGQSTIVRPDVDDGCSLQYRQSVGLSISNKETSSLVRHRPTRRRRDEELVPTSPQPPPSTLIKDPIGHRNNSAHFDLEASAFPPLPGIEISSGAVHTNIPKQTAPPVSETVAPSQVEVVQAQWGESRLADVVKGTARPKTSSTKDKEVIQSNETLPQVETSLLAGSSNIMSPVTGVECKDAATGSSDLSITLTSTVAMTPPFSPDKLVPLQTIKCTMADKSTKTDESLLNGDVCELACPTTTNAATMTVIVTTETTPRQTTVSMTTASAQRPQTPPQTSAQTNDNGPPRMSYAQVAQHHKERLMRERQNSTGEQSTKEKLAAQTIQSRVTQQDSREHKESRGNARRSAKSTRSNQANSHANLKIQTSPNRASSPNQSGENILHQSSVQTDGIIDSNDTIQQRDGGQIRYSTGRGAGRTYDRVQGGGPGRRRSGIDQRPQFREFLGNRSPK